MSADLRHFAINADDVEASRAFYEGVFGWTFTAWGPPGFYQIATGGPSPVRGALQERRDLGAGATRGFECTFAVDDVDAARQRVLDAGGDVVMERFTIAGVGHLIGFLDPSGHPVLAMEYDDAAE